MNPLKSVNNIIAGIFFEIFFALSVVLWVFLIAILVSYIYR